jgi:alpha-galactosidase
MTERTDGVIIAAELHGALDAGGFPLPAAWDQADPIHFDWDWQGQKADPLLETEVRLLWTRETLFVRFRCRYRTLTVFEDCERNGRRDHLWDRDVAELFLQPEPAKPRRYWEFEVAPNGMWIDLDISPAGRRDPQIGMRSQVARRDSDKLWIADLALPMNAIVARFEVASEWRVNFFRCEGPVEPRFYSAWRPTDTPQPNFHVPEAFGKLRFQRW